MERSGPRNRFSKILAIASTTVNQAVAKSTVGKYFNLEATKSTFTKELRAGIATFVTMAYIISINASILTDSGGPCTEHDCTPVHNVTSPECKFVMNPGYQSCLARIKNDLTVATSFSAMIACFAMGSIANLPLALAPGMGANSFFAYNMVGFHGSGALSYSTGLAVVMLEGCLFLLLSATGLRSKLARLIPRSLPCLYRASISSRHGSFGSKQVYIGYPDSMFKNRLCHGRVSWWFLTKPNFLARYHRVSHYCHLFIQGTKWKHDLRDSTGHSGFLDKRYKCHHFSKHSTWQLQL